MVEEVKTTKTPRTPRMLEVWRLSREEYADLLVTIALRWKQTALDATSA